MNDVSTRVVQNAELEQEAPGPDREGTNGVGESDPEGNEDHPGKQVHAAEKGTSDEYDRDGFEKRDEISAPERFAYTHSPPGVALTSEYKLEIHHGRHREVCGNVRSGQRGLFQQISDTEDGAWDPDYPKNELDCSPLAGIDPSKHTNGNPLFAKTHTVGPDHPRKKDGGESCGDMIYIRTDMLAFDIVSAHHRRP